MKTTKNVEYGIIALVYVAQTNGRPVSVKDIAAETGIPNALLSKIFQSFAKAKLVISVQGKGGGYMLARKPNKISLIDIYRALSEQIAVASDEIKLRIYGEAFDKLQSKVEKIFYETKLSDLIKNYKEKIMKHLNEILQNKITFFKFMSKKFPVKYKSNIFLRDVQFAIKDYFDKKKIKLSYTDTENMAKELMKNLVENGEAEQLTEKSWEFLIKLED